MGFRDRINALARAQRHLLRLEQLLAAGIGARGVRHRVERGRLHRLHAGVYATHPPPYSREQLWLAATYACGPGALLSDLPAGGHWGIFESPPLLVHVSVSSGRGRSREGIVVHRRAVDPRDVRRKDGILCTSPARTIIDCAPTLGAQGTEAVIMAADSMQLLNRRRLEELVAEHRGRPGIGHVRALITDDPVEVRSRNEARFFSICREFGVSRPKVNHRIEAAGRTFYADFCWPELRLIVEADSWRWHGGRQASENDADRDQLLAIAGFHVVHFTRDQIRNRRAETGRRLVALTGPPGSWLSRPAGSGKG